MRVSVVVCVTFAAAIGFQSSPAPTQSKVPPAAVDVAKVSTADGTRIDKAQLDQKVQTQLNEHGSGIAVSMWLSGDGPAAWYELASAKSRPAASAIKTFHLVELYAAFAAKLDDPLPEVESILDNAKHPALAQPAFAGKKNRDEIRRVLGRALARGRDGDDAAEDARREGDGKFCL